MTFFLDVFSILSVPTLVTTPAISCPGTNGKGMGIVMGSLAKWTSVWQMPQYLGRMIQIGYSHDFICRNICKTYLLDVDGHIVGPAGVPLDGELGELRAPRGGGHSLNRFHLRHILFEWWVSTVE